MGSAGISQPLFPSLMGCATGDFERAIGIAQPIGTVIRMLVRLMFCYTLLLLKQ